ncbi:MAG: regulatory protein RecX [Clostridia bacterium]|nr:regulatory protein RecX [Clostridia bacterium]
MRISIYKILALGNGEEAEISLEISNGNETQYIKGKVSASMLSSLELPAILQKPIGVDREKCEEILRSMKLYSAIRKGLDLLGYAKNTAKALLEKLKKRGYSADIAEAAVFYLLEKGYIREEDDAALFAENLAKKKAYGKQRIRRELFHKGFPEDVIRLALDSNEIDFSEICLKRIRSMGGIKIFETSEKRKKAIASLLRYGFSYEDIREAREMLCDEEDEE